jgi:hypothetical protein
MTTGLTRAHSEAREQAVLRFFLENPRATGDEAQKALVSGRLTGEKGPPMGIGRLFKVKRQAELLVKDGANAVSARPMAPEHAAPLLTELRNLTGKMQTVLQSLPDVAEVRVTRAGAIVVRSVTREEPL